MSTSPISPSSFSAASSGIDVNSIVSQLMQVEAQPLQGLKQKETDYQTKISAYATLLAAVKNFQTSIWALQNTTVGMTATSSNTAYFTATGSSTAVAGTTPIQIGNLASAQSLMSARFGSQTSAVIGTGDGPTENLQIQVGTNAPTTIAINTAGPSANNTLSGIVSAINKANAGVTASIVKESSSFLIDSSNNQIAFSVGATPYTATIAAGNYTGTALASAIQTALNAQAGAGAFTVDYGATSLNKLTIQNNTASLVTINWATAPSANAATPQQLGFDSSAQSPTIAASGGKLTAANAIDATYKLALASNTTGAASRITVKVDKAGGSTYGDTNKFGLSVLVFNPASYDNNPANAYVTPPTYGNAINGTQNMSQSQKGLDALLRVNGVQMFRSSNTITDAVTGVTLNLLQGDSTFVYNDATKGLNFNLTVGFDSSSLAGKLNSLVSAYNATMTAVTQLYGDQNQPGALNGDSLLMTLADTMRNMTGTAYGTEKTPSNNYLTYIGITHDKNGVLQFDSTKLSAAYATDATNITTMINNMATQMKSRVDGFVNTTIPAAQDGYQTMLKDTKSQETALSERLTLEQQTLQTKYIYLDQLLTQLNSTSNFLSIQMSSMTKSFGSK